MGRLKEDWRIFGRLMRNARVRLSETPGTHNKLKEAARIARKAREKLLRRLKRAQTPSTAQLSHSRQSSLAAQRAALSALLPDGNLAACIPAGGGAIVLSIEGSAVPTVLLRDASANLHGTAILDRHSLLVGPEGRATTRLMIQSPVELLDGPAASVDVVLRMPGEQVVFERVPLETSTSTRVNDLRFENSCVILSGERRSIGSTILSLGLFVDGELSASCQLSVEGQTFSATMILDHAHLDGRAHLLELREMVGMNILATLYQILPLHITPWQALQAFARPPLDGTLAQQARHHFHSYRLWFDRLYHDGPEGVPPLDMLYAEIQQGFRKRPGYPRISFPRQEKPTVSVVIPAHNKFEVTYYCLCCLLFAYNETSFEVVVVDDGSTDETIRILEFVDGIELLRRKIPQGFVKSCNDGAARARGEFVVLLNNDTEVTARWLDEL